MNLFRFGQDKTISYPPDGATLRFARPAREPYTLRFANGTAIAFSPDGRLVATYNVRQTKVWETETGKLIYRTETDSYTDEGLWKIEGFKPVRWVNTACIIDGGRTLVDLDHNFGEAVTEDHREVHLLPVDADHFLRADPEAISLTNRAEKVTLWTFRLPQAGDRKRWPYVQPGSLFLDRDANRILFVWTEKAGKKGARVPRLASLGMDGKELRQEFATDVDGVLALSPTGKSAVLMVSPLQGTAPQLLIDLPRRRQHRITFPSIERGFLQPNEMFGGFLPGEVAEFLQQHKDGTLEYSQWDTTTGKAVRRYRVVGEANTSPTPLVWSPDRKYAALIRQARDKMFWTVSIQDAQGRLVRELDDTRQTIAFDQRQAALTRRVKEAEEAEQRAWQAHLAEQARKNAADRLAEAEARRKSGYVAEKETPGSRALDTKRERRCEKCYGQGRYSQDVTTRTATEGDYLGSYTQYDLVGNSRQIYRYGVRSTRYVSSTKQVWYACPYCGGKGTRRL